MFKHADEFESGLAPVQPDPETPLYNSILAGHQATDRVTSTATDTGAPAADSEQRAGFASILAARELAAGDLVIHVRSAVPEAADRLKRVIAEVVSFLDPGATTTVLDAHGDSIAQLGMTETPAALAADPQ